MGRLLNKIKEPNDIKRISPKLYPILAQEIRDFLIDHVSQTGGHLASNLGAVEITMALHICLHFPEDKVVYDVGHQSYVHKILTGRKEEFPSLRQKTFRSSRFHPSVLLHLSCFYTNCITK